MSREQDGENQKVPLFFSAEYILPSVLRRVPERSQ